MIISLVKLITKVFFMICQKAGGGEKLLEVLESHKLVRTHNAVVIEGQGHAQDGLQLENYKVDQGGGQHQVQDPAALDVQQGGMDGQRASFFSFHTSAPLLHQDLHHGQRRMLLSAVDIPVTYRSRRNCPVKCNFEAESGVKNTNSQMRSTDMW